MPIVKNTLLLFLFFLSGLFVLQAQNNKITQHLYHELSENVKETYPVWIFFYDKGNNIKSKLAQAESLLPKHAVERRKKLMKNKPSVATVYDIPISENYLIQTLKHIKKLRQKSNWLNAISAEVTKNQLNELINLAFVKKVDIIRTGKINRQISAFDFSSVYSHFSFPKSVNYNLNYGNSLNQLEQINVPEAHDSGYNGSGIIICMMDAGFNNLEHQVFEKMISENRILGTWDFVNNDTIVDDEADMGTGDHGTMTLSTIGGFFEGQLIGPAYGAEYVLAKTENTDSETTVEEDNWVAAMEWAENNFGPDITSTSLGYISFDDGTGYDANELDGNTATITIGADIAASLGILVINSAGNEGGGVTTIGAPADGDSVLAVGAVDTGGNRSSFSSVGPTGDGRIKPEIMAQGSGVTVASPSLTNSYELHNGTSFSCPLAAGAAAVLMQMMPDASNTEIVEALKTTANNHLNPDNEYGWGIINIMDAYKYLNGTLGIPLLNNTTNLYPNPAKNLISINSNNSQINTVIIYSLSGQELFRKDFFNSKIISLNTENLKNGIYLCKIISNDKSSLRKFTISK